MLNRASAIEWAAVWAMSVVVNAHGFSFAYSNTDPGKR